MENEALRRLTYELQGVKLEEDIGARLAETVSRINEQISSIAVRYLAFEHTPQDYPSILKGAKPNDGARHRKYLG